MHPPSLAREGSRRGEFAPGSQTGALEVEREHADDADEAQAREQGDAPVDAEVDEERPREEDAAAGEGGAEEVVGREQGGGVLRVRERDVDEDALEDDEGGAAVDDDADDAGDPGEVGAGGPGEDEEADGREEGRDERGHETVLLRAEPVRHDVGYEVEVEIGDVDERSDGAGDEDAGEEDADDAEGEVVVDRVDEREDFEEGVVDSVHQGRVGVDESDGRVFDGYLQGLNEGGYDRFRRLDVLLVDF